MDILTVMIIMLIIIITNPENLGADPAFQQFYSIQAESNI